MDFADYVSCVIIALVGIVAAVVILWEPPPDE